MGAWADPASRRACFERLPSSHRSISLINTGLVAGAVALSTRKNVASVWQRNFLWSAPSYLVGAALAAVATAAGTAGGSDGCSS